MSGAAWRHLGASLVWVALGACELEFGAVECADGTICPAGWECGPVEVGGCVAPGAVEFCEGRADGTLCTTATAAAGVCDAGGCRATVCGDGQREGLEVCEASELGPATCVELGYDAGRTRCNDTCDGAAADTCAHIGWRDLGFDAPILDATVVGDELWISSTTGVFRRDAGGTWQPVRDGSWSRLIGRPGDVWAFAADGTGVHWDGVAWTETPPLEGEISAAILTSTGPILGGLRRVGPLDTDPRVWRWTGAAWAEEVPPFQIVQATFQQHWVAALHEVNEGVVAAVTTSFALISFPDSAVGEGSALVLDSGAGWQPLPNATRVLSISAVAGTSVSELVVTGEVLDAISGARSPRTDVRRFVPSGEGFTAQDAPVQQGTRDLGGAVVASEVGYVILGEDDLAHVYEPSDERLLEIESPGLVVQALSGPGGRPLAITEDRVLELGVAAWSRPVLTSNGDPTRAFDLSVSGDGLHVGHLAGGVPRGKSHLVDTLVARPVSAQNTQAGASNEPVAVWLGATTNSIVSVPVDGSPGALLSPGGHSLPSGFSPRDLAGNALDDLLVVGAGPSRALRWRGALPFAAVDGDLPPGELSVALGLGDGAFLVAGAGGLLAWADLALGPTWTVLPTGLTDDLVAIAAAGRDDVLAVGGPRIVRCQASGCTVTEVVAPGGLTGVAFVTRDDAWAVGAGVAFHWDGVAWSPVDLDGRAPSSVVRASPTVWFGGRRLERLVPLRPWDEPTQP